MFVAKVVQKYMGVSFKVSCFIGASSFASCLCVCTHSTHTPALGPLSVSLLVLYVVAHIIN